jgi:HEAT repeat protein
MNSLLLALSLLAAAPQAQTPPDSGSEIRFHRIHLRNGNFIDGKVTADKPTEVILLMAAGEMSIRRDQIDRVEVVKMKSFNDKAIILDTPKAKKEDPSIPRSTKPVEVITPEQIKRRVDIMLLRLNNSTAGEKEFAIAELQPLGDEGATYLASKAATSDLAIQNAIMSALIVLGKPGPKLSALLEEFMSHDKASLRGLALTVVTATGSEAERARLIRTALRDPDAGVRIIAISSLGSAEDKSWFSDAVELIGDANKDVRSRAVTICRRLSAGTPLNEKLVSIATTHLRSADPAIRGETANLIGVLGILEAWSNLTPLLRDTDASVRAAAAQSLLSLAAPESGPEIVPVLAAETDRWVRIYLAGAAQKMRLKASVEPLISWLSDPNQDVCTAAESALRALTGQTFGADQGKWNEWFQGQPK